MAEKKYTKTWEMEDFMFSENDLLYKVHKKV